MVNPPGVLLAGTDLAGPAHPGPHPDLAPGHRRCGDSADLRRLLGRRARGLPRDWTGSTPTSAPTPASGCPTSPAPTGVAAGHLAHRPGGRPGRRRRAWVTHRDEVAAQRALVDQPDEHRVHAGVHPDDGRDPAGGARCTRRCCGRPALIALALITTLAMPDRRWTRLQTGAGVLAVAAGDRHRAPHARPRRWPLGWVIAVAAVAVFLFASYKGTIGAIAGLALLLSCAQLLQNSRDDLGLYYLSPYNWAFSANPVSDQLHTAVNTQEWLLASTTRADTILSWVRRRLGQRRPRALRGGGDELWGENRVTLEPTLNDGDIARLGTIRPSMIAMYGQTMDAVLAVLVQHPGGEPAHSADLLRLPVDPQPGQRLHRHPGACVPDPADVGDLVTTTVWRIAVEAAITAVIAFALSLIVFGPLLGQLDVGVGRRRHAQHLRQLRQLGRLLLRRRGAVRLPPRDEPELLPRHRHHREHLRAGREHSHRIHLPRHQPARDRVLPARGGRSPTC